MTRVAGVLLAAGAGRRMGRAKALVTGSGGVPWVVTASRALAAGGCAPVFVVVGAEAAAVRETLRDEPVTVVEAADWSSGMGASLRAGVDAAAAADPPVDAVLVHLVDLPGVGAEVVRRLVAEATPGVLARASYGDDAEPGHPVLLGRDHWVGAAAAAHGDGGARTYLAAHEVSAIDCRALGHGADADRPEDVPPDPDIPTSHPLPTSDATRVAGTTGAPDPSAGALSGLATPRDVDAALRRTGYLPDEGLATVTYLALAMQRPLLLEGEPGTGKTALAEALAQTLGIPLIRLQCYEGIDATQALYDWDFTRQILHLRTVEAAASVRGSDRDTGAVDDLEQSLFDERFLLPRPILRALRESPAVLLVDEIDRADDEFEAFLLEVLSTGQVTIPEFGTVSAAVPPVVILTSNRTRELHDALKRRCLYHWIDHPGLAREVEILRTRLPEVDGRLAHQVATVVAELRLRGEMQKPPGVAETLDWARALHQLGARELDLERAAASIGALCKYREDTERVRAMLDRLLTV